VPDPTDGAEVDPAYDDFLEADDEEFEDADDADDVDAMSGEPALGDSVDEGSPDAVTRALQPGAPLLLLHRGHQYSKVLPIVLRDLTSRHGGALHVGVVSSVPRTSPSGLKKFMTACETAPIRIADPEGFARDDSFGPAMMAQRGDKPFVGMSLQVQWPYFTRPQPAGYTADWVEETLDVQRTAGATVLLTPGVWADPAAPQVSLDVMRQHAQWAKPLVAPDEHLAVNVTIPSSWLTNTVLLTRLLDEIVDMQEEVFYIRVRWPLMAQPYGQLIDGKILDGYVEMANTFEDNDKTLLLPNTSLTGWTALAWGAHGFSTGIGSGERAFADTRLIRMRRTGPRPEPVTRIFSTPVLQTTDTSTAARLESLPGLAPCACRFCVALRRLPAGRHDKELAGGHYLRTVGDLTAEVATHRRGLRAGVRNVVRAAERTAATSSAAVPLIQANEPRHLSLWAERLR